MAMIRTIRVLGLGLVGLGGIALAQGATKTWDFQGDAVSRPPTGFSFGRTGQGGAGQGRETARERPVQGLDGVLLPTTCM